MRRLTGLDATFLYLETPTSPMHVGSTAIYDPSTVPGGYTFDKVKELIAARLHLLPPFRWRLVIPFPEGGAKLHVFELTPVADQPEG